MSELRIRLQHIEFGAVQLPLQKKKVHLLFFIIYFLFFYFSLPLLTSGFLYVKLFWWNCNRDRHGRRRRESAQHFCFICRNSENSITNISACAKEEFTSLFLSWILSLVPSQFRPVCKKNEMNRHDGLHKKYGKISHLF
jgi:hypothetical protein